MKAVPSRSQRSSERGFTLVEILVSVAVIGILATIAVQNSMYALESARLTRTMSDMRRVSDAVILHRGVTGATLPDNVPVSAIAAELAKVTGSPVPQYDAWGNPLIFASGGSFADSASGADSGSGDDSGSGTGSDSGSGGSSGGSGGSNSEPEKKTDQPCTGGGLGSGEGSGGGSGGGSAQENSGSGNDGGSGTGSGNGPSQGSNPCNGGGSGFSYRVMSFGKDGVPDSEPYVVTGIWTSFNSDVVMQDGQFVQSKW